MWKDLFKLTVPNIVVGVGVALVMPLLLPVAGAVLRPLAKGVIKGGLTLYDAAAGLVVETGEQLSDLYAEAKAEHYGSPE